MLTLIITYNEFGQRLSAQSCENTLATYVYDAVTHNLKYMTYGNSQKIAYSYDKLDRLVSKEFMLKYFIEDCVRNHDCQFIISTHSPFILSLRGAKIYDIDSSPVIQKRWTELEGVRVYSDFFFDHMNEFER